MKTFKAMQVTETNPGIFKREIIKRSIDDLEDGAILIRVKYSSLNYKDALSATGNKGVTRKYPHTPGIDAAGIVEVSNSADFKVGDNVIVTGYDLGMNTSGGFGEYIRVPASWVVRCPTNLGLKEAMSYGTAGFTAALAIYQMMEFGVKPQDGEILVTGATGGVGSIAVGILSKLGFDVIAATGKVAEKDFLLKIGAKDVIARKLIDDETNRAMLKSKWAGVIDTVGGKILATAIKTTNYGGCVTCCGNIAGDEFTTSVYPFILRGVSLIGIDSVQCPMELRMKLWNLLANEWKIELELNSHEILLTEVDEQIELILAGKHLGRTIIKHN